MEAESHRVLLDGKKRLMENELGSSFEEKSRRVRDTSAAFLFIITDPLDDDNRHSSDSVAAELPTCDLGA